MKAAPHATGPADSALRAELLEQAARLAAFARDGEVLREANQNLMIASVDAQNLRDAAEMAHARQNEFLAMLAHELRNPLAPISMANAMLARLPSPSAELLHLHAIIQRQVAHLTRLLDDLLDAARISSGKVALVCAPLALIDVLRRAVETVQVRVLERAQGVTLDLAEDPVVDGDPVRLAQVFANLLVNASKYTGNGGTIRLTARSHEGFAVVTVADNGAGIAADVMPHIFDLFTQGPRALARSEGGLGVGLNVVRNIVQLHGGTVSAVSDGSGSGSAFTVRLPLAVQAEQAPLLNGAVSLLASRRILVVEDNLDANDTLARLLRAEGHCVTSAYDGIAGLGMASRQSFDVLLCDIGLPGMDGLELIMRLRATTGAHVPFAIAISGYGRTEDRERAVSAGYGQYFVKPVDVNALLSLVSSEAVSRFIAAAPRPQ